MTASEAVQRFFGRWMELHPVEATFYGLHEHDARLPEGGLSATQAEREELAGLESELAGAEEGMETEIARYYVRLARFQAEELRVWARMVEAPDLIGTGVYLLFVRDFAPLDARLEAIASRLEAVPAYLAASRERLLEPVGLWNRIALDTAEALPALYATVVEAAPEGSLRRRLEAAAATAGEATQDLARWISGEVLARSGEVWALGEERFERMLALRRLPDPPDAIRELGRTYLAEFKEERAALVARHWPGRSLQEVNELVRSGHAPTFEGALDDYRRVIEESREFVRDRGLATVPEGEELRVEPTPSFLEPVIPFAAYEPPAYFDGRQLGIYMVTEQERGLGEHSRASILNTSVHEGYPGHHLQFACANQNPSLARLLATDFAVELVEGWAHYSEQLMYEQGFSPGPEIRFVQLNDLIWRACRIVIDVELSSGRMGFAAAVAMLTGEAEMDPAAAEAEVRRYTYTPGYQLSYLYGKHLLLRLREERGRTEGAAFDMRAFHDRLLYAGGVPAAFWPALF